MKYECINGKCPNLNIEVNLHKVTTVLRNGKLISTAKCEHCNQEMKYINDHGELPQGKYFCGSSNPDVGGKIQ